MTELGIDILSREQQLKKGIVPSSRHRVRDSHAFQRPANSKGTGPDRRH